MTEWKEKVLYFSDVIPQGFDGFSNSQKNTFGADFYGKMLEGDNFYISLVDIDKNKGVDRLASLLLNGASLAIVDRALGESYLTKIRGILGDIPIIYINSNVSNVSLIDILKQHYNPNNSIGPMQPNVVPNISPTQLNVARNGSNLEKLVDNTPFPHLDKLEEKTIINHGEYSFVFESKVNANDEKIKGALDYLYNNLVGVVMHKPLVPGKNLAVLPCGHADTLGVISECVKKSGKCPVCKEGKVQEKDIMRFKISVKNEGEQTKEAEPIDFGIAILPG